MNRETGDSDQLPEGRSALAPIPSAQEILTLTRPELLEALKTEIATHENDEKKPGWTTWVLLAAASAIIWRCLGEIENAKFDWIYVLDVFLLFAASAGFLENLRYIVLPTDEQSGQSARFFTMRIIASQRLSILGRIFKEGIILGAAWEVAKVARHGWILLLFFGGGFLLAIAAFVLSFTDYPFQIPGNKTVIGKMRPGWALGIPMICGAASVYVLSENLRLSPAMSISSIRIGLLAATTLMIGVKLCENISPSPILLMLRNVQRDILFQRISLESALRQTDIALAGFRVDDLLQSKIQPIMKRLEKLSVGLKEISDRLVTVKGILGDPALAKEFTQDEMQCLKALAESMQVHSDVNGKLIISLSADLKKLAERVRSIILVDPSVKGELDAILQRISDAFQKGVYESDALTKQFSLVKECLLQKFAASNAQLPATL